MSATARRFVTPLVITGVLSLPAAGLAQRSTHRPTCPTLAQPGSGTSCLPSVGPGSHHPLLVGPWAISLHGHLRSGWAFDPMPRGDDEAFLQGMLGFQATGRFRRAAVEVRVMGSPEPLMGPRGYPLLLQTGETADGFTPLYDRQHPHDLFMELAVTGRLDVAQRLGLFLHLAPVGEPALGPSAYVHRASGAGLPGAPLSHHWLDGTHISYGVATVGAIVADRVKIETSVFNAREPDHRRWSLDAPRFNSFSARLSVHPSAAWGFQISAAHLREPERLHPGTDIDKLTASVAYDRSWDAGSWHTTLAAGANVRGAIELRVGNLDVTVPARTQVAALAETTVRLGRSEVASRLEMVEKDELFPTLDPRHNKVYLVGKAHFGYSARLLATSVGLLTVGGAGALHILPADLRAVYGQTPISFQAFTQWTVR